MNHTFSWTDLLIKELFKVPALNGNVMLRREELNRTIIDDFTMKIYNQITLDILSFVKEGKLDDKISASAVRSSKQQQQ